MKSGIDYPGICVAFFCHDGNGNFVFHKRAKGARNHHGFWGCGGGGLEFGETIEEAMFRELQEEYSCSGDIEETLPPISYLHTAEGILHHWVAHPFIVRVNRDDVSIGEPHAMESLEWFSLDNLPSPLHPGVAQKIALYKTSLEKYS